MRRPGYPIQHAVKTYLAYCRLSKGNTPRWLRFQETTLTEFMRFALHLEAYVIESLEPFHLSDYLEHRRAEHDDAASTLVRRAIIVRSMARWAEEEGRVKYCRMSRAKTPKQIWMQRELPPWDYLWQLLTQEKNDDLRDAFMLLALTGLRRGELLALRWADIDLEDGIAHVRATTIYAPKSRRPRAVPLACVACEILRARAAKHATPGPFLTWTTAPIHPTTITKGFKALASSAGLGHMRLHDLRHAFASHVLLDMKADVLSVKEVLGHNDISVTRRYLHARTDSAHAIRSLMDGV